MKNKTFLTWLLTLIALIAAAIGAYALGSLIPAYKFLSVPGLPPFAEVNIPPQTQNGFTATIEGAYADAARIVFVVRMSPSSNDYFLDRFLLKDERGEIIDVGSGSGSEILTKQSPIIIEFNPATPIKDRLKGKLEFAVVDSSSDNKVLAQFSVDLDLPVHPALTFEPKQSFLSVNGAKILLDRVVITPSYTQIYLCYTKPSEADWMIGGETTLKIGDQQSSLNTYSLLFDSALGDMGKGGEVDWIPPVETGRCVKIGFPIGDADPQSITLNIPALEQSIPESIPADQVAEAIKQLKSYDDIDMDWHIGDHGAYPEWKKLPTGMSEQEAYRKFIGALGYIYNGQWEFNLQLKLQEDTIPVFSTSTYGAPTPISLPATGPRIAATLPGNIRSFDISPDKKIIAIATSQGLYLYDLSTSKQLRLLNQPQNVSSVAWSPDGTRLAVGGVDSMAGESGKLHLAIWNTSTWKIITEPEISNIDLVLQYDALAWSPDSALLATAAYERGVIVLNVRTGAVVSQQTGFIVNPYRIAWSPDGSRLVATGDLGYGIRRWRAETDEFIRLYDQRVDTANDVAWSPDGNRIVSVHQNGVVCFWTVETNACDGFIQAHMNSASSLAWSADRKWLATAAGAIRIWDTQTGRQISAFGQTDNHYVQLEWLSPDVLVSLATGYVDNTPPAIRFFDVKTGDVLVEFHGASSRILGE
jgi:WD40 repeat protein